MRSANYLRLRSIDGIHLLLAVTLLGLCSSVIAEQREWVRGSDGKAIQAEFVSFDAKSDEVDLRMPDGAIKSTLITTLSLDDQAYVNEQLASKAVRRQVGEFYRKLRKSDRKGMKKILAPAARDTLEEDGATFQQFARANRRTRAEITSVTVEGESAVAVTRVTHNGRTVDVTLGLTKDGEQWLVKSLSASVEEGPTEVRVLTIAVSPICHVP